MSKEKEEVEVIDGIEQLPLEEGYKGYVLKQIEHKPLVGYIYEFYFEGKSLNRFCVFKYQVEEEVEAVIHGNTFKHGKRVHFPSNTTYAQRHAFDTIGIEKAKKLLEEFDK